MCGVWETSECKDNEKLGLTNSLLWKTKKNEHGTML